jgi:hypothetical protein
MPVKVGGLCEVAKGCGGFRLPSFTYTTRSRRFAAKNTTDLKKLGQWLVWKLLEVAVRGGENVVPPLVEGSDVEIL